MKYINFLNNIILMIKCILQNTGKLLGWNEKGVEVFFFKFHKKYESKIGF